ncbi:14515_t:CDS:2 [Funneliformis caledonium]|uniref:14515_t:CDS:1 n=1 Tax=Funneliformis caledonium TaxID=1117310 RepID=A0A9N9D1U9_9GLOM|nr:14515_t:CDS:2 [Funneliformis caledonium]
MSAIYYEDNTFFVHGNNVGASISENDDFMVYDTIGLGEGSFGTVPHQEAVKIIILNVKHQSTI